LKNLKGEDVIIYSDSNNYVVQGINDFLANWSRNGWKNSKKKLIANVELWKKVYEKVKVNKVKCIHVKAHSGHIYNDRADYLANMGVPI
jgi:ribonuclease HI